MTTKKQIWDEKQKQMRKDLQAEFKVKYPCHKNYRGDQDLKCSQCEIKGSCKAWTSYNRKKGAKTIQTVIG